MAKKVQLMTNPKQWQVVDGVEVLVDVPQEDIDPVVDSSCVEIEGHRTLEETINQDNMFTPEIVETKVYSEVGGVYHDNVVDGAYEEAILYGNTQVNLVESMTSGTKYIPHSFTSFQGNESKIGNYNSGRTNQVAPLVKGVTMVNLCQNTSATILYQHTTAVANHNAKPNTKYTLKCKFTEKNKNAGIMIQSYGYKDGTWGYIEISKTIQNLGDDVLLTFTTHEQADSIIIYNNPAFCEDTDDSITLEDIMVIEGDVTDLDLPFFKGMRSVELSKPLINLFTDNLKWGNQGTVTYTNSSGNVTVTSEAIQSWSGITFYLGTLKQNTKYLVMWDSLTQTQTSTTSSSIIAVYDVSSNTNIGTANSKTECPTLRSIVFDTTGRDYTNIGLRVHATLSNSETGTTTVTGLRVFEWDDSLRTLDLQTIGYFSGTKYVSARTLETEGKNLYPYGEISYTSHLTNVDVWFDSKGTTHMHGDVAQKSKARFLLKKGTYTITTEVWVNITACQIVDDKEQIIVKLDSGKRNHTFTLLQDTYCTLRFKVTELEVWANIKNIQIERGETGTTYEAYQSRYYKPRETEEIILRSLPNGVCDTFNLQTGELVQNIGEIVLDGDENIKIVSSVSNDTHTYFDFDSVFVGALNHGDLICDSFAHIDGIYGSAQTVEGINIGNLYWGSIRILNSRLSSVDVNGFKTWLQENPVTVQYELAEPIITKLQTYNRVYNGQTNALASMGNNLSALTYYASNYYLKVGNLSPVPGIIEPITTIPYDVRLKPSTLYTIKYSRGGASNSMSFDLGGSVVEKTNSITSTTGIAEELTVRTPAILSHEQLILSGTGYAHNFIVVEGDIIGTELPYFEGMKDVKMPIVKNIGKNLFHGGFELGTMSSSTGQYTDVTTAIRATDYTKVMGGKQYVFYCDDSQYKFAYVQYDKDKKFLRTSGSYASGTVIKLQTDVAYVIIRTPDGQDLNNPHVKLALYEYEEGMDTTLQDYKENSVYAVQGEYPITSEMIEQGGFSTGNGTIIEYEEMKYEGSIRLRSKDLIPVKPNTTYHIDATNMGGQLVYNVYQWNGNRGFMEGYSYTNNDYKIPFTFTTTADTQYIHMLYSKYGNGAITVAEYDWNNFHMYELDSTINLRSLPNGVKDELNLLTGEYIQRVGETVLDGSEPYWNSNLVEITSDSVRTWQIIGATDNSFESVFPNMKYTVATTVTNFHNNRLLNLPYDSFFNGSTSAFTLKNQLLTQNEFQIRLPKNILSSHDVDGIKQWLNSNPLTVQYELAEPIISHVRLVSNNQERKVGVKLPNGVCNTYNPSTGITTVRVGKVVLDGNSITNPTINIEETVMGAGYSINNTSTFFRVYLSSLANFPIPAPNNYSAMPNVIAEPFTPTSREASQQTISNSICIYNDGFGVRVNNSLLSTQDADGLRVYLASNPITVWYELKYPQIQPDIVLPNGVHDEYNPETGVYTKRVGFIEFDGSEDETWGVSSRNGEITSGNYCYYYNKYSNTISQLPKVNTLPLCDKLSSSLDNIVADNPMYIAIGKTEQEFRINIPSGESSATACKQWLAANPIKVWYELATPITYQLTPYFGLPQPYAYEDGYLIHDSAYPVTTLPPEFKYKLVANRTGQVMQNNRKLQEHTTRLSNLEALIIEATIESLFNRELQTFELELMDIQLIDLGE